MLNADAVTKRLIFAASISIIIVALIAPKISTPALVSRSKFTGFRPFNTSNKIEETRAPFNCHNAATNSARPNGSVQTIVHSYLNRLHNGFRIELASFACMNRKPLRFCFFW